MTSGGTVTERSPAVAVEGRRRWPVRRMAITLAVALCAASMLVLGIWAYVAPHSFADFIDFAPYNKHLIHDAGAFQIGIGVTLVMALVLADGLLVALIGFAVASGLHTLSHWTDRDLGGHGSDVPTLGLLTLIAIGAIGAIVTRRST